MSYRPDIDGLRAVAVLSVLFYHAHLGFPGGYVGVDVFFVISGFLITGLLLKAIRQGTFSYAEFWERRVRRLVPALAVVTVFTAITGAIILLPEDLEDLGGALIAQPLLMSNVYFWRVVKGGYFGDPPEIRPLLHTWSLGVEEQFYVVFPILLMVIMKRQALARHLGSILFGLASASFVLSVLLTPEKSVLAFFTLPTRAWELILGGLLALRTTRVSSSLPAPRLYRETCALVGLGLVAYSIAFFHHETPFPGYAALVPCLGTALLIWANSSLEVTLVGRVLSWPAVVRVGQISYSLYLWHWPLIAYGDYLFLLESTEARWLVALMSCWLGHLSWRWIETPFRERHRLNGRKEVGLFFIVYALISTGLGGAYYFGGNLRTGSSTLPYKPTRTFISEAEIDNPGWHPPTLGANDRGPTFLLWGDSHAMSSLAPVLDSLGKELGVGGLQFTDSSRAPLLDWGYNPHLGKTPVSESYKKRWGGRALQLASSQKLKVVFLVGFWKIYSRPSLAEELQATVREFNRRGVRVVVVGDNPALPRDPKRQALLASRWNWLSVPCVISEEKHLTNNAVVYAAIASLAPEDAVTVIDLAPSILSWESVLSEDGKLLYYDGDHLSDAGSLRLRPLFEPIIKDLAR